MDMWDPMKFDEIIVSTLPTGSSRWLGLDLPHRLEKLTSVPVRHVVSQSAARGGAHRPAARAASAHGRARPARRDDAAPLVVVVIAVVAGAVAGDRHGLAPLLDVPRPVLVFDERHRVGERRLAAHELRGPGSSSVWTIHPVGS